MRVQAAPVELTGTGGIHNFEAFQTEYLSTGMLVNSTGDGTVTMKPLRQPGQPRQFQRREQ
jgi:hypothetical protein